MPNMILHILGFAPRELARRIRELRARYGPRTRRGFRAIGLIFLFLPPATWLWAAFGAEFLAILFWTAFVATALASLIIFRLDWMAMIVEAVGFIGDAIEGLARAASNETLTAATADLGRHARSVTNTVTTAAAALVALVAYALVIPAGYEARVWVMITIIAYVALMMLILPRGRWSILKKALTWVFVGVAALSIVGTALQRLDHNGQAGYTATTTVPAVTTTTLPRWEFLDLEIGDEALIPLFRNQTTPWYRVNPDAVQGRLAFMVYPTDQSWYTVEFQDGFMVTERGEHVAGGRTCQGWVDTGPDFRFLDGVGWAKVVVYDPHLTPAGPPDAPPFCLS